MSVWRRILVSEEDTCECVEEDTCECVEEDTCECVEEDTCECVEDTCVLLCGLLR